MTAAFRRALVLAPHTDDGEFGCGATIARLVEDGAEVHYTAFSSASRSLPAGFPHDTLLHEVRAATAELGVPAQHLTVHDFEVRTFPTVRQEILEILVAANGALQPDLVLMPSMGDIHQDHETIAREGLRAFKRTTLLGYEIPWNCFEFRQQAYVSLEQRHLERKVAALRCYESQQHRNYANEEYIRNVARTRGIESGRELAEVFEVYRWIV
jgi:N-acetylglucosamine malate deacetylase 1